MGATGAQTTFLLSLDNANYGAMRYYMNSSTYPDCPVPVRNRTVAKVGVQISFSGSAQLKLKRPPASLTLAVRREGGMRPLIPVM